MPDSQRVTPQVKAHLSVILGAMALVRTAGYVLDRFELNFSQRGVVEGASYTDVEAHLATACNASSLSNVTVTTACACDGAGGSGEGSHPTNGAATAARWLHGRPPGLYGMADVLGLAGAQR